MLIDRTLFLFVYSILYGCFLGGGQGGTKMQGPLRWCSLFSFLTLQKFWQPLGTWIETLILSHCKTWLATCYSDSIHTGCFHWIADIASNFGSSLSCTTTMQFHVNNRICLPCESSLPRSPKDEVRYYGTWPLLVWYDTQYYLEILRMIMNDTWHNMIWYVYCNLEFFHGKSSSLQANRCRFQYFTRGASGCDFGFAWIWISRFHTLDLGHLHLGENSLHNEKMEQGATQIWIVVCQTLMPNRDPPRTDALPVPETVMTDRETPEVWWWHFPQTAKWWNAHNVKRLSITWGMMTAGM